MGISGAGAVGAGMGAAAAGGAAGMAGGAGAAAGAASGASPAANGATSPGIPPNMQSLVDAMKDFSSAEILIALMLASAAGRDDDKSGSAATGFLAGLALAGGLAQSSQISMSLDTTGIQAAAGAGGAGLSLNVSI